MTSVKEIAVKEVAKIKKDLTDVLLLDQKDDEIALLKLQVHEMDQEIAHLKEDLKDLQKYKHMNVLIDQDLHVELKKVAGLCYEQHQKIEKQAKTIKEKENEIAKLKKSLQDFQYSENVDTVLSPRNYSAQLNNPYSLVSSGTGSQSGGSQSGGAQSGGAQSARGGAQSAFGGAQSARGGFIVAAVARSP